jgi:hypothetical protein
VSRPRRARADPPQRDEVEGFLDGVAHRVASAPSDHRASWGAELARARRLLASGDLVGTAAVLTALDQVIDAYEGEPELAQFPRGLVGYLPVGDRGHPTPVEDEPIANRLKLLGRLLEVRRSEGRNVDGPLATLREAELAYRSGDRTAARRLGDEAHRTLEREDDARAPREG